MELTSGAGGSVADALQYGVYGILMAPAFLYRTEFGADPLAEGTLASFSSPPSSPTSLPTDRRTPSFFSRRSRALSTIQLRYAHKLGD